ncbi:hypothetical protein XACJM35_160050 [Xanthomonas citri pv. citri]|nr:hypothetical protein XAC902_60051 [Xanthomonas citri pv. citri]CEL47756.1 hypothetical protein XACJM35_160050 [Xanthomonas citri pv. citri]
MKGSHRHQVALPVPSPQPLSQGERGFRFPLALGLSDPVQTAQPPALPIPDSRFPIPDSRLPTLKSPAT